MFITANMQKVNVFVVAQDVRLVTPDAEKLQLDYAIDRNNFNDITEPVSIGVQEIFTSVKFSFQVTYN